MDQGRDRWQWHAHNQGEFGQHEQRAKHCQQNFSRNAAFAQTIRERSQQQCAQADSNGHREELIDHALSVETFDVSEPGCSPQ